MDQNGPRDFANLGDTYCADVLAVRSCTVTRTKCSGDHTRQTFHADACNTSRGKRGGVAMGKGDWLTAKGGSIIWVKGTRLTDVKGCGLCVKGT